MRNPDSILNHSFQGPQEIIYFNFLLNAGQTTLLRALFSPILKYYEGWRWLKLSGHSVLLSDLVSPRSGSTGVFFSPYTQTETLLFQLMSIACCPHSLTTVKSLATSFLLCSLSL